MAVIHLRIDNRLIHGQVTVAWVNSLGADHLICTNDKVAKDPVQKMLLPQAARGIKTSVLSVADTAEYVKSEAAEKEKIMIIAKFPKTPWPCWKPGLSPGKSMWATRPCCQDKTRPCHPLCSCDEGAGSCTGPSPQR